MVGIRTDCCRCPEDWVDLVDQWFIIYTVNGSGPFFEGLPWQLLEVREKEILVRRPAVEGDITARIICQNIVALVEALELI